MYIYHRKSSSGGSNWTSVFPDSSTKEKFNLFLGGAAISTEKALITGAVAQTYSTDGTKFQESVKDVLSPSQDAEVTPGGLYVQETYSSYIICRIHLSSLYACI